MKRSAPALAVLALLWAAEGTQAEPMFLARQYNRCTTCHYSPTGGGLLTPYGRALSGHELSTTSRPDDGRPPQHREEGFLFGLLGDALGPVDVGIDVRPALLHLDVEGLTTDRSFFMNADLEAAWRGHGWTVYGEAGRQVRPDGPKLDSYEHWISYQTEGGMGVRAGRFFPAYGIRLADHTAFSRAGLGFDKYDQLYALELSHSSERHLLQLSISPGPADALVKDDGRRGFTATGRFQWDLGPRTVLVASGLYRDKTSLAPSNGGGGIAFGIAPFSRLSVWTQADAQFRQGTPGAPAYTLLNETSFEVFRGLWLKVSPQLRTQPGDTSSGIERLAFEADLLPRTHANLGVSYYLDRTRTTGLTLKTLLAQFHLYL